MGAKRVPAEAFEDFYALGAARSYAALAERYGISKQAIARRAKAERWMQRVQERDAKVRTAVENKVEETLADLKVRHSKILRAMTAKALEGLKSLPMTSAMDSVRALDLILKQERLLFDQPTEHTAIEEKRQEPTGPPVPHDMGAYVKKLVEVADRLGLVNARTLFVGLEKVTIASDGAGILARTPSVN